MTTKSHFLFLYVFINFLTISTLAHSTFFFGTRIFIVLYCTIYTCDISIYIAHLFYIYNYYYYYF
ncbi:hypothetical protein J3Q64DRAFT_1146071 [Phycomyces blakesleeanus]|uniref:Uncharacterized protein n=1 Tax=Phycomyces blakesleeanus TaxID=4837 RepID=A0ABR3AYW1_PHYBL